MAPPRVDEQGLQIAGQVAEPCQHLAGVADALRREVFEQGLGLPADEAVRGLAQGPRERDRGGLVEQVGTDDPGDPGERGDVGVRERHVVVTDVREAERPPELAGGELGDARPARHLAPTPAARAAQQLLLEPGTCVLVARLGGGHERGGKRRMRAPPASSSGSGAASDACATASGRSSPPSSSSGESCTGVRRTWAWISFSRRRALALPATGVAPVRRCGRRRRPARRPTRRPTRRPRRRPTRGRPARARRRPEAPAAGRDVVRDGEEAALHPGDARDVVNGDLATTLGDHAERPAPQQPLTQALRDDDVGHALQGQVVTGPADQPGPLEEALVREHVQGVPPAQERPEHPAGGDEQGERHHQEPGRSAGDAGRRRTLRRTPPPGQGPGGSRAGRKSRRACGRSTTSGRSPSVRSFSANPIPR